MSRNWFFEALLRIVMPACLFDTNSFCHKTTKKKRISDKDGIQTLVQPQQTVCVSVPFISRAPLKSQPVSTAISAHHRRVLSDHPAALSGGTPAAAAVLNFETDGSSAGCQIVSSKRPAYSSSLWTCCWRLGRRVADSQKDEMRQRWIYWYCYEAWCISHKANTWN